MTADEASMARRLRTLGQLIIATRRRQLECDRREKHQLDRAEDLIRWSKEVMAAREIAEHLIRVADEAHDANAKWEADLQDRESRLAHPSQPPATDPKE